MTDVEAFTLGVARFCKVANIDADDRRALASLLLMPAADATVIIDGIGKQAVDVATPAVAEPVANPAVAAAEEGDEEDDEPITMKDLPRAQAVEHQRELYKKMTEARAAGNSRKARMLEDELLQFEGASVRDTQLSHWREQNKVLSPSEKWQKDQAEAQRAKGGVVGTGAGADAAAAVAAGTAAPRPVPATTGAVDAAAAGAAVPAVQSAAETNTPLVPKHITLTPEEVAAERAPVEAEALAHTAYARGANLTMPEVEAQHKAVQDRHTKVKSLRKMKLAAGLNIPDADLIRATPEQLDAMVASSGSPELRNALNTMQSLAKQTTYNLSALDTPAATGSAGVSGQLTRGNPAGIESALGGAEQPGMRGAVQRESDKARAAGRRPSATITYGGRTLRWEGPGSKTTITPEGAEPPQALAAETGASPGAAVPQTWDKKNFDVNGPAALAARVQAMRANRAAPPAESAAAAAPPPEVPAPPVPSEAVAAPPPVPSEAVAAPPPVPSEAAAAATTPSPVTAVPSTSPLRSNRQGAIWNMAPGTGQKVLNTRTRLARRPPAVAPVPRTWNMAKGTGKRVKDTQATLSPPVG